jgi:hypothetical protein
MASKLHGNWSASFRQRLLYLPTFDNEEDVSGTHPLDRRGGWLRANLFPYQPPDLGTLVGLGQGWYEYG